MTARAGASGADGKDTEDEDAGTSGPNDRGRDANRVVVAIDGPAGSGKSSVSRTAARVLGFDYQDTGAAYRALA